jgi:glycine betaine/proline transport system substrate-binding protein
LAACALSGALLGPALAKTAITIGELTWDEPRAVSAVLKAIMEQNLDAEVGMVTADQSAIFAAMDKGDGSVDIHPAIWSAAQTANIEKYVEQRKTVALNRKPYLASDGFYVPKAFAEKHKITSVDDLKNPEIAKLFDINGDGRGDYWPGAPGWGVTDIYQVKARSYGLTQFYDAFIVPDALLKAQLKKAVENNTGLLFYYWTPEALHVQYDLVKLKEPKFDGFAMDSYKGKPDYNPKGCYDYVEPQKDPDWLAKSSITCETQPQPIYIGYSRKLEERAPKIAQFLSNVAITDQEIAGWIYEMAVNGKSPDAMAAEWVKAHPDRVKSWLAD